MKKDNHVLRIEPNSEAEEYFVNELMKYCENDVKTTLQVFSAWNEYEITHADFLRIRKYIRTKQERA